MASPYGFWKSPITSDLVVADSIRLEQVALDGDAIYWTETQPQKQGRTFLYRIGADGEPERVTPDDANVFSVRTRAHEYGGGSYIVSDGVIYFSNNIDQRLYRQDAGRPPSPITPVPAGAAADAFRYADGVIDHRRGRMVCVREDHTGGGEAITTLVAVDLSSATATQVLVSGNDFYSTPRLSPDGNRMSWLTWRHPDMPWVATEVWVGDILPDGTIGNPRRVAGQTSRCFSRNGRLTGISISYRTEVRAGGISIARTMALSSPWRRWTPNSGDRNGSSACRPTHSSPPIA
jgi:hypothetical protein